VAEIIEFEKRRQQQQSDKADARREEKIHLLQKLLQCARCQLKCARCGTQIVETDDHRDSNLAYSLCSGCSEEYRIYLELSRGELTAECYWYNEEWMQVWRTWLEHQQALDNYRNSREFIKLLNEFDNLW
jgi:Pyruvate/2-oxoacid:ferredoxin oxidoreductase delta subunit